MTAAEFRLNALGDMALDARDALRTIIAAYDACKDDEANRIGTTLMCALEAARKVVA